MKEVKNYSNLLMMTRKYPVLLSSLIVLGTISSLFYCYMTEPEYKSEAIIEKRNPENQAVAQINMPWAERSAITEKIMTESFVSEAIERNEGLQHSYYIITDYRREQTQYRFPYTVKHRVIGNPEFSKQQYKIEKVNSNIFKLTAEYNGVKRVLQGEFGKELIENNLALTVTERELKSLAEESFYLQAPQYIFTIESPVTMAKRLLADNKSISAKETNGIVTISCEEGHPDKAKKLTEAISNYLVGESIESKKTSGNNSTADIDVRIEEISKSMSETEAQIASYKKANKITDINIDTETSMAVLKELQLQKTNLEMTLATLDNLSNYLRKNIDGNNAQVEYGTIQDPEFITQINRLNEIYRDNGEAASASKEVQQLKSSIAERILNTRKKTTIQLEGINLAVNNYQRNLSSIPDHAAALTVLERKLNLDRKVYDLLSEKRAQAIVSGGVAGSVLGRIVRPATLPTAPSTPVWWMVALTALLSVLSVFRISTILIERKRTNTVNVEQTRLTNIKTPFLGSIELFDEESGNNEDLQTITAKIMMVPNAQTITITSANRSEGKTAVSVALAQNLAAMDKRVLVIDMNMYQPSLGADLGIAFNKTLADTLTGECDIHDAITITSRPNLEALTAGNMLMGINTWLSSAKKDEILSELKKHYDYIIIDTPGVNQHIDALPMIKISDITLFTIKTHSTRKDSLNVAENLKETHKIENLFCVLTPAAKSRVSRNKRTRERTISINRNTADKARIAKENRPLVLLTKIT
jgi:Mrp family chromosome partitioning ATPase